MNFRRHPNEERSEAEAARGADISVSNHSPFGAHLVAAGILLSRLAGLLRESVFAHFFGNSASADAFKAAFRIPNFLQNLFGEGVLSASFIPVYTRLRATRSDDTAEQLAWTVGALLFLVLALLTLAGVAGAPYLIEVLAPGFVGRRRALTVTLVQVLFPGSAILALSAWCLGVLNSHRRFFLSYAAPVAWNLAIIATLFLFGLNSSRPRLAIIVAWGAVAGAVLQLLVQLPSTLRLLGWPRTGLRRETYRSLSTVARNFVPVVSGRGAVQISAYIDNLIASFLPTGAVAALNYAQILYILPVSLFGMSIAAAELPEMSRAAPGEIARVLRLRIETGSRRVAFMVIPSAVAFIALGDVIAGAVFQSGSFSGADAIYVWTILAGSSVGMLAVTVGRLYSSAFYALWDTRTPLNFALIRVALTALLGYLFALRLPPVLGVEARWGVAGLTISAGLAGWLEYGMLRASLQKRIGQIRASRRYFARLWTLAAIAALLALGIKIALGNLEPHLKAALVLPTYAAAYLISARLAGVRELELITRLMPSGNRSTRS